MRTLSAGHTFVMKYIFPSVWIVMFGLVTLVFFVAPHLMRNNRGGPPPPEMKWIFLGVWIVGSAFIYWSCARIKRIRLTDQSLLISNYLEEIEVPLVDVASVSENRWVRGRPITIEFARATPFGPQIVFLPQIQFSLFDSTPIVLNDLRAAMERAQQPERPNE